MLVSAITEYAIFSHHRVRNLHIYILRLRPCRRPLLELVIYNFQRLLSSVARKMALHFHSFSWILTFWEVILEVPGIVFGDLGGTRDHLGVQGDPGSIF
jgi:hypothetical protein